MKVATGGEGVGGTGDRGEGIRDGDDKAVGDELAVEMPVTVLMPVVHDDIGQAAAAMGIEHLRVEKEVKSAEQYEDYAGAKDGVGQGL